MQRSTEVGYSQRVVAWLALTMPGIRGKEQGLVEEDLFGFGLRHALARVARGGWLRPKPHVLIHPMAMTEGGLRQVEERAFTELAYGAGAGLAVVWAGEALSQEALLATLDGRR